MPVNYQNINPARAESLPTEKKCCPLLKYTGDLEFGALKHIVPSFSYKYAQVITDFTEGNGNRPTECFVRFHLDSHYL